VMELTAGSGDAPAFHAAPAARDVRQPAPERLSVAPRPSPPDRSR
jgi:hypothetical protein